MRLLRVVEDKHASKYITIYILYTKKKNIYRSKKDPFRGQVYLDHSNFKTEHYCFYGVFTLDFMDL